MVRLLFLCAATFLAACAAPEIARVSEAPPEPRPNFTRSDLACLTEAIYFEAGNKGEPGRQAVAHVILNRVASEHFPDTVCEVIEEGQSKERCQFAYRCDLNYRRFIYPDQKLLASTTAVTVLAGETDDPTEGALFFHASYASPGRWFSSRIRVGNYGGNIFYL